MKKKIVASLLITTIATFASANAIQNSDFGIATGSLANWTLTQDFGGNPASGLVTTTSQYCNSTRFSAKFAENFSGTSAYQSIRQNFAGLTNVTDVSFYGLSFEQDIFAKLHYSDNTADRFQMHFTNLDNSGAHWTKWDLTSSVNSGKILTGIEIGTETGMFHSGNAAFVDDVSVTGTQAVPEPASMTILGAGALALLRRRNRKA